MHGTGPPLGQLPGGIHRHRIVLARPAPAQEKSQAKGQPNQQQPDPPPAEWRSSIGAAIADTLAEAETDFERTAYSNFESRLAASLAQYRAMEKGIRDNVEKLEGQASKFAQLFQQAMALTRLIDENRRRGEQIQERMN